MCGIFGYSGNKIANDLIYQGLKRLEYRGYDSWGIAVLDKDKISQYKNIGEIKEDKRLKRLPSSSIGIGHTRWATHGGVTITNAHPHISTDKDFTLVQNGIVENFDLLKSSLQRQQVKFKSQTDTEVIVKLIERDRKKTNTLRESIIHVFKILKGRNTIVVLNESDRKIYAVKNGSPLVIGVADDGTYIASDALSFSLATKKVIFLNDFDMVEIDGKKISIFNIKSGKNKAINIIELKNQYNEIAKGSYPHYMLKEIVEQKNTILLATSYTEIELKKLILLISKSNRVYVIGAGTAGFAAGQVAYFLRSIAHIDAQDIRSYDFRSYLSIINHGDVVIALSQSGETADTIEALEVMKENGCVIVSLVNMLGTTISRMSDFEFYTNAGPEICVASTKVFTAQCSWGYLLAMSIIGKHKQAQKLLSDVSIGLNNMVNEDLFGQIKVLAKRIKNNEHLFVLGKGENSFIALEGALKIKEISYKHIEGFSAGELKHGVIALIEKGTPVFGIMPRFKSIDANDLISSMEQVKARGAFTIGIGAAEHKKNKIFDFFIPTPQVENISSITNVVPFQLISYFLSVELGNNIDKPRNLAKSVTVK